MTGGSHIWVILSFVIAAGAALVAGGIVYVVMTGRLRAPFGEASESLLDGFGITCFRVANRVVISTLGGAVLIGLYRLLTSRPKRRGIERA